MATDGVSSAGSGAGDGGEGGVSTVDEELSAADAALLDALYGADGAGGGLGERERETLAGWRDVRGVVRHAREQGFDVEAPAAGTRGSMESLMTFARAHAPAPTVGWWGRLVARLGPMLAHPALAGAAALVVVGGAAGVLYLKGKQRVARPPAQERAPAREPLPPPGDGELRDVLERHEPGDRPGPARTGDGEGSSAGSSAGSGPGDDGERAIGTGAGPGTPAPGSSGAPGSSPKPKPVKATGAKNEATRVDSNRSVDVGGRANGLGAGEDQDQALEESEATTVTGSEAPVVQEAPPVRSAPPPAMAPPPPPAPVPQRAPARTAQIAVDDEAPTAAQRAQATKLTEQARVAAKAGDCAAVTRLSKQIASLDPAYHRDVFVRDPDIARCR